MKAKRKVGKEVELLGEHSGGHLDIMGSVKPAVSKRKRKKQQLVGDPIKQAEDKKSRLEKALANSAAIRAELIKKKQKKKEDQERLDEEAWASLQLRLPHLVPGVMDSVPSFPQAKPSNAATFDSRETEKLGGKRRLRLHFGKKIEHVAAQELDVGRSTTKKACRGIYIKKNPKLFEALATNLPPPDISNAKTTPQPLQMESETVMVKARYEDEIIKFKFSLSSTMNKLLQEVGRRLDLEIGSFKLRYLDEENDNILLACDDDLQLCLTSLTAGDNTTMRLFVHLIPNK